MDKPEALRLANELDAYHTRSCHKEAAAELRRLHASCEDYAQHKQRQDQRVLALTAQRDALLDALQDLCDTLGECGMTEKARAAIKKVQEGD